MSSVERPARVPRTMEGGDLAPWVAAFASELGALSHTPLTIGGYTDCARHFAAWLAFNNIGLDEVSDESLNLFGKHRCRCGGYRRAMPPSGNYLSRVHRFIVFLAGRGVIAPLGEPVANPIDPLVEDYQAWLTRHRGICALTAKRHGRMVMRLLPALGGEPQAYDAGTIRTAILREAQRCLPAYTKTMTTALRGYLRFLAAIGLCRPGLEHAVPLIPHWRLSALPRYLSPDQVERLIASCDVRTGRGVRDRAILLLLARLGLRAGDILEMRFGDIDWSSGTLRVKGKGRRETRLPMPQDAGDAVLGYLDGVRPSTHCSRLFVRSIAPFDPFASSSTVSNIVALALKRAGIDNPPSRGANLLRHSAATHMLRGGATLHSVGAVLRHRSLETTTLYAKVDLNMLARVAQPWPGDATC
ncbi:tyrosine-type recombinase/integrase [Labrys okinawensis]|uniref:tyrosine-type recombinase/integrase n=1 Tax=Labrys okinawensis TaxID=346911 RepID=UPI0039BC64DD